ncbi:hypothetical protein HK096_000759 [Nowakowskiella sp. JEL0078]|nr:hypothetical protein HK096_000759 [Nowakowskiella sp. JEL0078]
MASRKSHPEETDANELKFGEGSKSLPEFQNVQCLLVSEVRVLLEVAKEKKAQLNGMDMTGEWEFPENN